MRIAICSVVHRPSRTWMPACAAFALALLISGFCLRTSFAQQRISGRVITVDGVPVWKAIVRLRPTADTNAVTGAITDEDGRFEFLLTGANDAPDAPRELRLEQNYPNPFSSHTTLRFSLPGDGEALLALFDRAGRRVRTLLSGRLAAGAYSIAWDGRADDGAPLSAGPYHAMLVTRFGTRSCIAAVFTPSRSAAAPGLVRQPDPAILPKTGFAASYRLEAVDTVEALPRFTSRGLSLNIGESDTTLDITVEYGGWEDLEFPSSRPHKLFFDSPYLYVCALRDGLWRKNMQRPSAWEYLGLGDSLSSQSVRDVDVIGDRILVAFAMSKEGPINHDSIVSIWRSTDSGKTWNRADSSIRPALSEMSMNAMVCIKRATSLPGTVFSILISSNAVFKSTDDGVTWRHIYGGTSVSTCSVLLWISPLFNGHVYLMDVNEFRSRFSCISAYSDSVLFSVTSFYEGAIDMEFPVEDSTLIYKSMGWICSSTDGGRSWVQLTDDTQPLFQEIVYYPVRRVIYGDAGRKLYSFHPATRVIKLCLSTSWDMDSDYILDPVSPCIFFVGSGKVYKLMLPE